MKNFYIDSLQIHDYQQDIGYTVHGDIEGLAFPEVRVASYDKPGEYGAYLSNTLYAGRLVTLSGRVWGATLAEFNQRRRALMQAFAFQKDENGAPTKRVLKFQTMDDLSLQINCVAQSPMRMNHNFLLSANWQIDVFSPDFYIEGQTEKTTGLETAGGGGIIIPVILPAVFEAQVGGSIIVANNGTTQYYPTILLNGKLTNPVIYNTTIDKYVELNKVLLAADTDITIDMKNKTIKQGSTPVLSLQVAGSVWWWLEPGNNVITLTTDDSNDDGNIQITYRDSYLGV